jgi:hypothetical protein
VAEDLVISYLTSWALTSARNLALEKSRLLPGTERAATILFFVCRHHRPSCGPTRTAPGVQLQPSFPCYWQAAGRFEEESAALELGPCCLGWAEQPRKQLQHMYLSSNIFFLEVWQVNDDERIVENMICIVLKQTIGSCSILYLPRNLRNLQERTCQHYRLEILVETTT